MRGLPLEEVTAEALYLLGRSCVGMLLEDEVIHAIGELMAAPEPGPQFADLLRCVWTWRVGDPKAALAACPAGDYPPLIRRDADMLRGAGVGEAMPAPVHVETGVWRAIKVRAELPNVLGIGMQRTGTTWIFHHLSRCADVHTLPFKEAVFFDDLFRHPIGFAPARHEADFGNLGRMYWQGPTRSLRHYRALFGSEKPLRFDFSPSYGELPAEAVSSVRELLGPDSKIILSVRDPAEGSWSNFLYNLRLCGQDPRGFPFSERVALYRNVATLRRCDYAAVLRVWRAFFDHVEVVFMDDIEARPRDVLRGLRRFLGMSELGEKGDPTRLNVSYDADLPREDRVFLLGLHQSTYDNAEAELGGPALRWRQRQMELIG